MISQTSICSPSDSTTQSLEIRSATTPFEIDQLRQALNREHYLKAGRPAGNTIWQGIYRTDTDEDYPVLCAVLCWSGAALRLKDHDEWIDWDPLTRASRLPLVTQLRRFLILDSQRQPNLATRCMGLALRHLPEHFEQKYRYRPLLAESFSDPQPHEGTIYKASNWTPLGFSKGYRRHKSDFYQDSFHQYACKLLKDRPVDHVGEVEKGHGRFEIRDLTVVEVDTEVSPFPYVAQIIKETRIYRDTKDGALPSMSVRIFGTSHRPGEKSVAQLGKMIREHWSVENRNHPPSSRLRRTGWKGDATRWREDRSPRRYARGAKNLALLRNALLSVIPFEDFSSLNDAFVTYLRKTYKAVSLILSAPPITNYPSQANALMATNEIYKIENSLLWRGLRPEMGDSEGR